MLAVLVFKLRCRLYLYTLTCIWGTPAARQCASTAAADTGSVGPNTAITPPASNSHAANTRKCNVELITTRNYREAFHTCKLEYCEAVDSEDLPFEDF